MTREDFLERARSNARPVVVDVWASWCMPCRKMAPALQRVSDEFRGRVDLWKVDAEQDPELVQALGVMGVPTLIVYGRGGELVRRVGAQSEEGIRTLFAAAEAGVAPLPGSLPAGERLFRISAAAALAGAGMASGPSPLLLAFAGLVLLSAFSDRCPLWRAVAPRLGRPFRRQGERPADEGA